MNKRLLVCAIFILSLAKLIIAQDIVLERKIKVGNYPKGIATNGSKCYVPDVKTGDIYVIDTSTYYITSIINAGSGKSARDPFISPDGKRVYVLAPPDEVVVIDTDKDQIIGRIAVPVPPTNIVFSSDGLIVLLYILSGGVNNFLTIIDAKDFSTIAQIPVPATTVYNGLAITPDNKYVLATCGWSNVVAVIDIAERKLSMELPVGQIPLDIAIDPKSAKAFVANFFSKDVAVIDLATFSVESVIPLAGYPFKIKSNTGYIWVLSEGSDTVDIIDASSNGVIKTVNLPGIALLHSDIAFRPDTKLAVVTSPDTGEIVLFDSNHNNTTFGDVFKTLSTDGFVTNLVFHPGGDYVYVVDESDGSVLVCAVSGGLDTLADIIAFVIDQIAIYLTSSELTDKQKDKLKKAMDKLIGNSGGSARNGALQKVNQGALESALVKIKQAIKELKGAESEYFSTAEIQKILTIGSMHDTYQALSYIEAQVGSSDPIIIEAWELYQQAVDFLNKGEYIKAIDHFIKAISKAKEAIE